MPPALALAEEEVTRNISEISEWQRIAFRHKVEERQKHRELMSDMKADIRDVLRPSQHEPDLTTEGQPLLSPDSQQLTEPTGPASNGPGGEQKAGKPNATSLRPEIPQARGAGLEEGSNSVTLIGGVSALVAVIALVAVWVFRRTMQGGG